MSDIGDPTLNVSLTNDDATLPVKIKTVDSENRLCVDTVGTVSVVAATDTLPIQIKYNKAFTAINANEWQEVAEYTVPTGYNLTVLSFRCSSETAGERARVFNEVIGGTFNCATNTFTNGLAYAAPQFGSGFYIEVTTAIGAGANDTVTVTYTNEIGTTGRTCTIVIPKSSPVGTAIEGVLQGSDLGIRDITNVTHSATGQAGAFGLDMYYSIFDLLMTSSGVQYQAVSITGSPVSLQEGGSLLLSVLAGTKTSYIRQLSMFGTLDPV